MCSSLFRGEIKLARIQLTQSVQRSHGTQHYQQFISEERFLCFYTAIEAIFSAVCDHFWTKTLFSTSSFWGSVFHFLDDLDYLLCNTGVSFWFYPIEIHFF